MSEAAPTPESDPRALIARTCIRGQGIEIGALHAPLEVPDSALVRYVDRLPVEELRKQYPELDAFTLVDVDIIDDGEVLRTVADGSQDFVIANHFLEHCQDPFGAMKNMLRVLRAGGYLYMALPDKRFTFDVDHPVTTAEHIMRDFEEGPDCSRREHFEEWARLVVKAGDEPAVRESADNLIEIDYSIHFHVWTQVEMLEMLMAARAILPFELSVMLKNGIEVIFVLEKLQLAGYS